MLYSYWVSASSPTATSRRSAASARNFSLRRWPGPAARQAAPRTTHTITGASVGVGAARRAAAVRSGVAQRIVIAWGITMPAAALIAAACYGLTRVPS